MSKARTNVDLLNDLDIAFPSQFINAKNYGAKGDGVTDDTAALQAAINAAIYTEKKALYIPSGRYLTSDTLHLGYGTSFQAAHVFGDGPRYRSDTNFSGTAIITTKSDRPAINMQGLRNSRLENLSIRGTMFEYIASNAFGQENPAIDDLNPANWVDPALLASNPNMDSRYAPHAGISIDAYSGAAPTPSYPTVNYPAFLGPSIPQYGKGFSSKIIFHNLYIDGFVVGAVVQPCDADGNGDFITFSAVTIAECKYGISVGNSQGRCTGILNSLVDFCYVALINNQHGRQLGSFGGSIINTHFSFNIKICTLITVWSKSISFINCYSESLWQLGEIIAAGPNELSVIFQTCYFGLNTQTNNKGIPPYLLSNSATGDMTVGGGQTCKFIACLFSFYKSVAVFGGNSVFDSCKFSSAERGSSNSATDANGVTRQYVAYASNGTCDGVIVPNQINAPLEQNLYFREWNTATSAFLSVANTENLPTRAGFSVLPYLTKFAKFYNSYGMPVHVPERFSVIAKSTLSSCTLTGKTLTLVFSSRSDFAFAYLGPDVGDVLVDRITGSTFFVRNRSSLTVTAELQNNYKSNGSGGWQTLVPISLTTDQFYIINSRFFVLPYYLRGDSTSGNNTLTNCATDTGSALWYDAEISVDDWVFVDETSNRWIAPASTKVTARDQSVGTITLGGNAARSEIREPLLMFIRKPATGVP
jgi:hypothetical protein